jgi:hypothetical protein
VKREGSFRLFGKEQIIPFLLLGMTGAFAYNIFFFFGMKTVECIFRICFRPVHA